MKCHYLAAFTAAMLNQQPMGFYSAATLVKDAQRHGLHFKPVDITCSQWECTVEKHGEEKWLRLGFNYVKGLNKDTGRKIVAAREQSPFRDIRDLVLRVPSLGKVGLNRLAASGALNSIPGISHRRDALWQSELAIRPVSDLLEPAALPSCPSPLAPMGQEERLSADFHTTGLTIGLHPMSFYREYLKRLGVVPASTIRHMRDGSLVSVAGAVICRQRPQTAKGFVFLSLEDETGIVNIIVEPDLFDENRASWVKSSYLRVDGLLQNQDGAVSLKAYRANAIVTSLTCMRSHDFR